ncbi:MAG: class I SAM-dependent methyltransferase [Deltaproteobacteria bacterium]|nr:class I SAM-dependent methyltransferase [Deltaproteobacteria bacterium]
MFDKYQKYGAYHWNDIDTTSFYKILKRSLPLHTRYQKCLKNIPQKVQFGVEIGCGDGALTYLLAEHGTKKVLGCDTDQTGIKLAREKVKDLPLMHSVRFECSLLQDCNLEDESVDIIIMADVIEHLDNPSSLLDEIKRIGKPGGRLILTTPKAREGKLWDSNHVCEYTEETLVQLLKDFFPKTNVSPFMPLLFYRAYNRFQGFRFLFNMSTMVGFDPFSIQLPGQKHVMLLSISDL